ncbi:MAG: ADP-ribosylglycohydrolase family protein, partial [Planctomycetes bacterium]|nr:ADP-ribosylglycohydrolase family protein [Planctomycetota bacterium]
MKQQSDKFRGLMLGTAVGDSLGLPAEGFGPELIKRLGWSDWRHRFVFGKGMVSDDTEHTLFVAQALLKEAEDSKRFQVLLARKLRWWLLGLPAGIGWGTLRAILKLWLFFPVD